MNDGIGGSIGTWWSDVQYFPTAVKDFAQGTSAVSQTWLSDLNDAVVPNFGKAFGIPAMFSQAALDLGRRGTDAVVKSVGDVAAAAVKAVTPDPHAMPLWIKATIALSVVAAVIVFVKGKT